MVAPRPSAEPRAVGARVLRREDPRFLTGRGRYVSDVEPPSLLHAAFVRSPHAHARVLAIDVSRAAQMPGVLGVLTGDDWNGEGFGELPCIWQVDSSERGHRTGTGLGLSVVQRLMKLLGGHVSLESELGRGSEFTVCLPSDRS